MGSAWRAVAYIMGANFQALLLFVGANELSSQCGGSTEGLCAWEPFFLPFALVVSAFVYYKVLWFLARSEGGGK